MVYPRLQDRLWHMETLRAYTHGTLENTAVVGVLGLNAHTEPLFSFNDIETGETLYEACFTLRSPKGVVDRAHGLLNRMRGMGFQAAIDLHNAWEESLDELTGELLDLDRQARYVANHPAA